MKMYFLEEKDLPMLNTLMKNKVDNQYIILNSNKQFVDIAQYSAKYQNIHFASLPLGMLDTNNMLYNCRN